MENTTVPHYQPRKGVHVPKDVKEYILKRVRESGKSAADIAREHGIAKGTLSRWVAEEGGSGSNTELVKLQKENQLLKQLVAELSLKVRESEKRGW